MGECIHQGVGAQDANEGRQGSFMNVFLPRYRTWILSVISTNPSMVENIRSSFSRSSEFALSSGHSPSKRV